MYTFFNQGFLEAEKVFLHASDLSIQRGYGIFDFLKVWEHKPVFIDDYLDRFYHSAQVMDLEVGYEREGLKKIVAELIQKNGMKEAGIKLILTGGYSPDGYKPGKPNLIIQQNPLTLPGPDQFEQGLYLITHEYVREIPRVKTINYITGIWIQKQVKAMGADDVLYALGGEISEMPRCNVFIVRKDGVLVTPEEQVLHGVTRKHVLELAEKKFKVVTGKVTLADLAEAREAFLTSTTKRILPVVKVDNLIISHGKPGPVTRELSADLLAFEKEWLNSYVR